MKELERTLVAAIAAALLTSPAFAQASHRNDETVIQTHCPAATGGGSLGCNEAQGNVERMRA
jgi:hypothetical protein